LKIADQKTPLIS